MKSFFLRIFPMFLLAALAAGCGSSGSSEIPEITPSVKCDRYLTCLGVVEPEAFPAALQVYRSDGPCWFSDTSSSTCERACEESFSTLSRVYWEETDCMPKDLIPFKGGKYIAEAVPVTNNDCGWKTTASIESVEVTVSAATLLLRFQGSDGKANEVKLERRNDQLFLEKETAMSTDGMGCTIRESYEGIITSEESFELSLTLEFVGCEMDCRITPSWSLTRVG